MSSISRTLKVCVAIVVLLVLAFTAFDLVITWSAQEPLHCRIVEQRPMPAPSPGGQSGGWEYLVEARNASDSSIHITSSYLRRDLPPGSAYGHFRVVAPDFLITQVSPHDPTSSTFRSLTTSIPARSTRRFLARLPAGEQDFLKVGVFDMHYTFFTGSQYRVRQLSQWLPPKLAEKLALPSASSGHNALDIDVIRPIKNHK